MKNWLKENWLNWLKIIEKINKLSLPVAILLTGIILGGFYYGNQIYKQYSIEKQQRIESQKKAEEDSRATAVKGAIQKQFEDCMIQAHTNFEKVGTVACLAAGYTQDDIDNLKCILPGKVLGRIENKQTEEQDMCRKNINSYLSI